MELFGPLLRRLLAERGESQRGFAARVGVHYTTVNKIIGNFRQPFWRRADAWAEALGLTGQAAEDFKDSMCLAASPPRVRELVRRLEETSQETTRRDNRTTNADQ